MTFRLVVNRLAQRRADEIVDYLAAQAPEHVHRFIGDLESVLIGIAENPLLTAEVRPTVRTRNLTIFPFGVWYRIFTDREPSKSSPFCITDEAPTP